MDGKIVSLEHQANELKAKYEKEKETLMQKDKEISRMLKKEKQILKELNEYEM